MDTAERTRKRLLIKASMAFAFVVGLIFIVHSVRSLEAAVLLDKKGITVAGRVKNVVERSNTDADWLDFEVDFVYATRTYRICNHVMDMDRIYTKGDEVAVIFLADAPEDAIINSRKEKYSANYSLILIGLVVCSSSCFVFFSKQAIEKLMSLES